MITSNHDEACYLVGGVVEQMFSGLASVSITYRYVSRAIDVSFHQIAFEEAESFAALAARPEFADIFAGHQAEIRDQSYRTRVGKCVYDELQSVKRRAASSALVFAHSIFESSLVDCLAISFHAEPKDWLDLVGSKKVVISELTAIGIAGICSKAIAEHIDGLQSQSVLKKLDTFFQVTRPPNNHRRPKEYAYDRERIAALDKSRHTAAHCDPLEYDPSFLDQDIGYFRMTLLYLLGILVDKYGVRHKARPIVA